MPIRELPDFRYRGARTLVLLQDRFMREFLPVWMATRAARVPIPACDDPDYASMGAILHHVLRASRGYMTWLCEKLELPDPGIEPAPPPDRAEQEADRYLEHLLARWRLPLAEIEQPRFEAIHQTRWGEAMSLEGMLEHAAMHPLRHRFQLEEWMEARPAE